VSRAIAYRWRQRDPKFAAAWNEGGGRGHLTGSRMRSIGALWRASTGLCTKAAFALARSGVQ